MADLQKQSTECSCIVKFLWILEFALFKISISTYIYTSTNAKSSPMSAMQFCLHNSFTLVCVSDYLKSAHTAKLLVPCILEYILLTTHAFLEPTVH